MRKHRNYKDGFGYMLETSRSWVENPDDGRGDSVARTVLAGIIYGQPFIDTIEKNFKGFLEGGKWKPIRHPETPRTHDFSRDHTVFFIIWLRYFKPELLKEALRIPWRLSDKFTQMGMWLWVRAVAKDKWFDRFMFWATHSIILRFNNRWNRLLRGHAKVTSSYYKDFKATPNIRLNDAEMFAREYSVPGYAIENGAWMVNCLTDGWFKRRLQRLVIRLVEPTNWVVRMLMDESNTFAVKEKMLVAAYEGMDGWRWGRRLDKTTDIDLNPLEGPQPEYNMDVDILDTDFKYEGR